jgi:hypothetical protein
MDEKEMPACLVKQMEQLLTAVEFNTAVFLVSVDFFAQLPGDGRQVVSTCIWSQL